MNEDSKERLRRIKDSGIDKIFTPSTPISVDLFCGRTEQTDDIIEGLLMPGGHVVLFGDRGVGKTSLALYVASQMYSFGFTETIRVPCESNDDFSSVAVKILKEYGIDFDVTVTTKKGGGVNGLIRGSVEREVQKKAVCNLDSPTWLASKIENKEGLLIIDEFDTIKDIDEKEKFSQLIKYLSDKTCGPHILLVGISRNVTELMGGHASADRSLTQVRLPRMDDDELADIIEAGEQRYGKIHFRPEVVKKIVSMSHGMPYFTHSLALEAAKIVIGQVRVEITLDDFDLGLKKALKKIELSLQEKYKKAVGVQGSTKMKKIIYAAASIGCTDSFLLKEWTDEYSKLFNEKIQQPTITGSMSNRIGDDSDKIISKLNRGEYIFNDSRMPCYILLLGKPE